MRAVQQAYPNPPRMEIRRIIGEGDLFVVEGRSDYGHEVSFVADIVEFRDGRICRETRFYAAPFEPPPWRAGGSSSRPSVERCADRTPSPGGRIAG